MNPAETLWRDHLQRLGEFIKGQRQLNQLSQRQLAKLADLSDTYMSQLERGRHEPSLSVLRALADSLGIRPDQLILFQPASRCPTIPSAPRTPSAATSASPPPNARRCSPCYAPTSTATRLARPEARLRRCGDRRFRPELATGRLGGVHQSPDERASVSPPATRR